MLLLSFAIGMINHETAHRYPLLGRAESFLIDLISIPYFYLLPALIFVGIPVLFLVYTYTFVKRRLA